MCRCCYSGLYVGAATVAASAGFVPVRATAAASAGYIGAATAAASAGSAIAVKVAVSVLLKWLPQLAMSQCCYSGCLSWL